MRIPTTSIYFWSGLVVCCFAAYFAADELCQAITKYTRPSSARTPTKASKPTSQAGLPAGSSGGHAVDWVAGGGGAGVYCGGAGGGWYCCGGVASCCGGGGGG